MYRYKDESYMTVKGDIVERIKESSYGEGKVGDIGITSVWEQGGDSTSTPADGKYAQEWWRAIETKPGSEAKIGDTVICVNNGGMDVLEVGNTYTVHQFTNRDYGPFIYWTEQSVPNNKADCFLVLQQNTSDSISTGELLIEDIVSTEEIKQPKVQVTTPERDEAYYTYFQKLFTAGIKLEFNNTEDSSIYWRNVRDTSTMTSPKDRCQYRLTNHTSDCPEPNTQAYVDYWQDLYNSGKKVMAYMKDGEPTNLSMSPHKYVNFTNNLATIFFIKEPMPYKQPLLHQY